MTNLPCQACWHRLCVRSSRPLICLHCCWCPRGRTCHLPARQWPGRSASCPSDRRCIDDRNCRKAHEPEKYEKVKIGSYRITDRESRLINNYKYIYQCIYRHHLIKWNKKVFRIHFSYGQSAVSTLWRARTYMIMNAAQINECVCCDENAGKRKCATKSAMGHTKLGRKSAINQFD